MHKILRVVIDTNHIMSAILSSKGASSKLIEWMTKEEDYFQLLLSQPIWDEYKTVSEWLIPDSRKDERERILAFMMNQAQWIKPIKRINVCNDVSDNAFLECAVEGKADYLVTKKYSPFSLKKKRKGNPVSLL